MHWTRSHGFVEVFSHLSGRGLPMKDGTRQRVSASDATRMIRSLAARFSIHDLTGTETFLVLEAAEERDVQGARIHDLLHARAATLAKADLILTRDRSFSSLGENIPAQWP